MINPQKAIEWYKGTYGDNNQSDYDIYEYLKRKYTQFDYPENPYQNLNEQKTPKYEEQDPSMWRKLLTYSLADNFAEDSKWAQQAYNLSTAGTIYEIMNGKKKYEDAGQAEGWWDEIGQFFVGLASPVDVVSFFGSGAIGGAAAKSIGKSTLRKWALTGSQEMMKKQAAKKGISQQFHKYLARQAGIESGLSLGMLGATHGTLHETAKQSSEIAKGERDSFNPWEISYAAAKNGATNVALGSVAGYYTKGIMAPKFAKAQAAQEKNFSNKLTRLTMNPVGQVAAEASVFTTGQVLEQAIAGQPVSADDFLSGFFMNTGIVGGMRLSTKVLRLGQDDLSRYKKAKDEFMKEVYKPVNTNKKVKTPDQQTKESLESVEKSLIEQGISTEEISRKIAEIDLNKIKNTEGVKELQTSLKEYNELLKQLDNNNPSKLPKESQAKLIKDIGGLQSILHSVYSEMKNNKELAYQAFKDQIKTNSDKLVVDNIIKNRLSSIEKVHEVMNLLMNGDKNGMSKVKEMYAEGFEYKVNKIKDGVSPNLYELSIQSPSGEIVKIPGFSGNFSSQANAIKAGNSIKKQITDIISGKAEQKAKEVKLKAEERNIEYYDLNPTPKAKKLGLSIKDIKQQLKDLKGKDKLLKQFEKEGFIEKKTGLESDVNLMIESGVARLESSKGSQTAIDIGIANVNKSNSNVLTEILSEVKEVKEMNISDKSISYDMPIKKGAYDRLVKEYNEFQASPKGKAKSGELNRLKKEVWESGNTKKIISSLAGSDTDLITAYKMGEALFSKSLATSPKENTKLAIKIIGYLNNKDKKLHEISAGELADLIKEGIPKYKISFVQKGKEGKLPSTVSKDMPSKKMYNSGGISSLRQIVESLRSLDFISNTKEKLLRSVIEGFDKTLNESRGKGIKPAKEKVRRTLLERADKLSQNKNDEGYSIAAKLASKFYIRDEEINRMSPKKLKNALKRDGEDYYLDMSELKKYKTIDRFVWIDKDLGRSIELYTGDLSLKKYVTEIGRITPSDNKKRLTDTRRRAQTMGAELGGGDFRRLNYLLGHEVTKIQEIYNVNDISSVIKSQKKLHKEIKSPISELNPTQKDFLRLNEIKGNTSKEIQYSHRKALGAKYPELVIDLVKEFKDKSIPKDAVAYLEKLENWTVRVKMGKAPSDAIPHEVSHYMFKVMDALGKHFKMRNLPRQEQNTLRLVNEAKKIFVDKNGKFNEESAVKMIGKAIDGQLQKPMLAKAKSFFKRLNVFFKQLFNKPLNKNEISYILGRRIIQRKGIPKVEGVSAGREYLKAMELPTQKFLNVVSRDVRIASKEMGINDKQLIKFIADEIGIEKPKQFNIKLPKDELSDAYLNKKEQIVEFYNAFQSFDLNKFTSKKNTLEKLKLIREIDASDIVDFTSPQAQYSRIVKGITPDGQSKLLKNVFGVKDGNLFSANLEQLKSYKDYIYQLKAVERDNMTWITKSEINKFASLETAKTSTKVFTEGLFLMGEVGDAIKNVGFKKLGYLMNKHYSIEQGNQKQLQFYERNVKKILGGLPGTREAKLRKVNEYMWTLDNKGEMYLAQQKFMNQNIPDKAHFVKSSKWFKKAIKKEWFDTVKEGKDKVSRGADLKKYINLETKEGQVANEYIKLSESFGQKKLEDAIRQKSVSEAEYLDILKNSQINFLGTHIARNFTTHGKTQLRVGEARDRAMKSMVDEIALSEAYKKYGKDNVNKDLSLVENMRERAIGLAAIKFDDMLNFNAAKLSIKHLKERHSLQELYTADSNGKLQRTYEYKFDRTVKPYIWGMSKFYSTLEVFPEMVTFEGFRRPGIKKLLASLETGEGKTRVMGRWIKESFLKQLGMENSSNPYDITYRSMETAARILAKTGLSFPTAGAKNLLAGQTQGLYAQSAYDWGRGMLKVFTADAKQYNEALATNAFGVGNKIYEANSTTRVGNVGNMLSEFAFTFGFMKPTERYNRLASIFAAKYDINRQVETLKNFKPGNKKYDKAVTRLKWYNVNEKDIKLLGKYGSREGVEGYLTGFEKLKTQRKLDNIHQIMNTAAHVKTQGSSADLFMPKWAGTRGMKPLTLFKRMAFAATSNTIKNVKQAKKEKNIIKPIMGVTATYLTGQAMIGIYSNILGTEMPKENSDWFRRFWTIMWKGEFMGILSDWLSPFDNTDSLNPAIWNSMGSIFTSIDQLKDGKVTKSQAFNDIVKKNLSGYNNYIKIKDRTLNPLNKDRVRFGKLYGEYEQDVLENPNVTLESTSRTKYFKDLSTVFYTGDEKEFSKQLGLTFVAIAHDYYRTNRADGIDEAFKMAESSIKRKLTAMNPNKASLFKTTTKANKSSVKFLKWLKNHKESDVLIPRLFEIEKEYNDRLKLYMSKVPKYWKELNIGSLIKDFKWEQKKY